VNVAVAELISGGPRQGGDVNGTSATVSVQIQGFTGYNRCYGTLVWNLYPNETCVPGLDFLVSTGWCVLQELEWVLFDLI
jgi:hypothetical protein